MASMKIIVPAVEVRVKWESLSDMPWDAATIFEIVQRWCDAQDHAKNWRTRNAAKQRLLKDRLGELAKASGLTVEEYLEIEEKTLSTGGEV